MKAPTMRAAPTSYMGWAHLPRGQSTISTYLFDTLVTGIGRGTGVVTCILPAETFSVGQVHKTHHLLASYFQNTAKGTTDPSVENLI